MPQRPLTFAPPNPGGKCMCGCGADTPLAVHTNSARGLLRGQPVRYLVGHQRLRPIEERYDIDDNGCWVWNSTIGRNGYSRITRNARSGSAHRWMYEQRYGPVPKGMHLDHLCRNRACVNPEHLEVVTCAENAQRGANAKLTPPQVAEIRWLCDQGWRQADVLRAYGLGRSMVTDIARRRTWANVEPDPNATRGAETFLGQ